MKINIFIFIEIKMTESNVLRAIERIDVRKGAGSDGIPSLFIKRTSNFLTLPLKVKFETSMQSSTVPTLWKEANLIPIFKRGEKILFKITNLYQF